MVIYRIALCAALTFTSASPLAFAEDQPLRRGLYWYERPIDEKSDDVISNALDEKWAKPTVPPMDELMHWHPRDINELFVQVHEYHVMEPTLETGGQVQMIKAVMNKKARAAAAVEQLAMLQNPGISGMAENAVNPTARSVQRQDRDRAIDARLVRDRGNYALILLTQTGCGSCVLQRNIIANFIDMYGWEVKEVNISENPIAAARFGVNVTPTTLIVSRESGEWQIIAIGSETLPTIRTNTFQAVRLMSGEIMPNQWLTSPNQADSLYDPNFR